MSSLMNEITLEAQIVIVIETKKYFGSCHPTAL
jgi:hypothetical protein